MTETQNAIKKRGVIAALATPLFLGVAPIFGKFAIESGADPFTVAALRTMVAVALLWLVYGIFFRRYIFIYPAGLLGCIVIGTINGIGSLFYYSGLQQLDASLVQLINGTYLAFAMLLSHFGGQSADRRTALRVMLALAGLVMIAGLGVGPISSLGIGLMLANALMFAGTVVLSQYVVYEMPTPTAALYILTTMGVVVTMVWLAVAPPLSAPVLQVAALPIVALGITTAISRLAMFASVKFLGGMQTAIMAAAEIGVALLGSFWLLGESLTSGQWGGVVLLFASILLIRQQDLLPHGFNPNQLIVANMASVQFQRIAFHRAFGTQETDNAEATMETITTQEMIAIQRMMGASSGAIDPFPIGKTRPPRKPQVIGDNTTVDPDSETTPSRPAWMDQIIGTRPADSRPESAASKQEMPILRDDDDEQA